MTVREGDEGTRREHLEAAARSGSAAAQAELDQAAQANAGHAKHVWEWFLELHAARSGSGFGPNPIGYADIDAWARLSRRRLAAWEVAAIRAMDQAYLEVQGAAHAEKDATRERHHGRH